MRNVVASPRSHRARHESSVSPTVRDGDSGRKIPPTIFVNGVARSQDQDAPGLPQLPESDSEHHWQPHNPMKDNGQPSLKAMKPRLSTNLHNGQPYYLTVSQIPWYRQTGLKPAKPPPGPRGQSAPQSSTSSHAEPLTQRHRDHIRRTRERSLGRSRVKIGITTEEKWGNRISAVARTHAQTFHMTDIYHAPIFLSIA